MPHVRRKSLTKGAKAAELSGQPSLMARTVRVERPDMGHGRRAGKSRKKKGGEQQEMRAIWKGSAICLTCESRADEDACKAVIGKLHGEWTKGAARFRAKMEPDGYPNKTPRTIVEVKFDKIP